MPPATAAAQTSPAGKAPDYAGSLIRARQAAHAANDNTPASASRTSRPTPRWIASAGGSEEQMAREARRMAGQIGRMNMTARLRPTERAANEQRAETEAGRSGELRNRRLQNTEGQRQEALLQKQGPLQRLRQASVPGGGQLNGYMILRGLHFAKMFTYWHTIYIMDVMYFMGANSKFLRSARCMTPPSPPRSPAANRRILASARSSSSL